MCGVVRRELVSCASERAGPRLGMIVDNTMWIQNAAAAFAPDRLILEGARVIFTLLERGVPGKDMVRVNPRLQPAVQVYDRRVVLFQCEE